MNLAESARILILTGAWALSAIAAIWLFVSHPLLPDEGQAWLWATALDQPLAFLAVPGEGHPPLWFALLHLISRWTSFEVARGLNLVLTLANGLLLIVLLRDRFWLALVLVVSSITILFWGVLFRPYTIVFTIALCAMLAEQRQRHAWAGWLLALATGFHFYAQLLFGFWLLVSWGRKRNWTVWLGPAVLAALFALSVIISGQGNAAAGLNTSNLLTNATNNFVAGFGMATPLAPVVTLLIAAWLFLAFQKDPMVLALLVACLVLFALFTALVYGYEPWHLAFMSVLVLLAALMARTVPDDWRIALLLLPWVWTGGYALADSFAPKPNGPFIAYYAIKAEQGAISPGELVVWPDYLLAAVAAQQKIRYTSGNDGSVLGPVNWRNRTNADIHAPAFTGVSLYWLICAACENLAPLLDAIGAEAEPLIETALPSGEALFAYRITLPDQSSNGS